MIIWKTPPIPIKETMETAEKEQAELTRQIAMLQEELENKSAQLKFLRGVLEMGKKLRGSDVPEAPGASPAGWSATPIAVRGNITVADRIVEIFREIRGPLTPKTIATEFHRKSWPLSEKAGADVVRRTMTRRTDLFTRHRKDGTFSLKDPNKGGVSV